MSANSILLHFCQSSSNAFDENAKVAVKKTLEKYFGGLDKICEKSLDGSYLTILSNSSGVIFSLRFFDDGLATLNIEYFIENMENGKAIITVIINFID